MSQRNADPQQPQKRPLYYGWWIAGELAISTTFAYGILFYAFSVFIAPMEADLGWSRATIYGAFSVALMVSGITGVAVGWWLDRHGARLLMTGGSIFATALMIAWSTVSNVYVYYAIWFCIGLTMASLFYEPAFTVIANWFTRKRGRALALVTFVAGFASTIFLPLSNWLLEMQGWRGAVFTLGIMLGVTLIPLNGLMLRRRPEDMGLLPDGDRLDPSLAGDKPKRSGMTLRDALRDRAFWVLTISWGLAALSIFGLRAHLIPLLIERDFDPALAATLTGLIGAMQVVGRVIFAPLESRVSLRIITAAIFALEAFGILVLIVTTSAAGVIVFVVAGGAAFGAQTLARASLVGDIFGVAHYGRISSMMSLFLTGAVTIAPVGAATLYTAWGGYNPVLWVLLFFSVLSFIVIWFLPQRTLTRHYTAIEEA